MNYSNYSWKNIPQIYNEHMILSKKLPIFFDIYDMSKDFDNVYEPAEDTFLMIDCLTLEKEKIDSNYIRNSAEIGCGSGLVSACFFNFVKDNSDGNVYNHFCVDVNKDALDLTQKLFSNYFDVNYINKALFVESDLFKYFIERGIKLDCVIFNPPYVTTDKEELEDAQSKKDISAAWAGGSSGSEVIYSFIEQLEVK